MPDSPRSVSLVNTATQLVEVLRRNDPHSEVEPFHDNLRKVIIDGEFDLIEVCRNFLAKVEGKE